MTNPQPLRAPSRLLTLEPIGYVRTRLESKVEAARQPAASGGAAARIELLPDRNFAHALLDLDGWSHVWVLFWFDRNSSWRPKVLPPRSRTGRKGVFATRSPHRPNPLGLSAVRLDKVEGLTLHVRDVDMLDGTPVLDIKPYVAYTDAIAEARSGWLADVDAPSDPVRAFDVRFEAPAREQAAWIERHTDCEIQSRVAAALALGPEPHPYRRIRPDGEGFILAVKAWRVRFRVVERIVTVVAIASGYRTAQLEVTDSETAAELAAHRRFQARWG